MKRPPKKVASSPCHSSLLDLIFSPSSQDDGPSSETDGLRSRQILKQKLKNTVDKEKKILHNLVSLLLMQRRKTEVDVVAVLRCAL
ncbi:protein of unknown function [Caballeronia sp. S22]